MHFKVKADPERKMKSKNQEASLANPKRLYLTKAVFITGLMALILVMFPAIKRLIQLNITFLQASSSIINKSDYRKDNRDYLSSENWLLTGSRGGLRKFQILLATSGPDTAFTFLQGLKLDSQDRKLAYTSLGQAYINVKEQEKAIASWLEADARTHLEYNGEIAYESGDIARALEFWEATRDSWRRNGIRNESEKFDAIEVLGYLVDLWREQGSSLQAAEAYEEIATLVPKASVYINAGDMYRRAGKLEKASIWYQDALDLDAKSWKAYYGLGLVAQTETKVQEAMDLYLKAIEVDDQQVSVWIALGNAYEQNEQLSQARQAYQTTLQLDPLNKKALQALEHLEQSP